jgi:hypothetical protein
VERISSREADIKEVIFRGEDLKYTVTAYCESGAEVIFYSVTTLDDGFEVERSLGVAYDFQLNSKTMRTRFYADSQGIPNYNVFYSGGWTGSTPTLVVEPGPGDGSNASMQRTHFTGVNMNAPHKSNYDGKWVPGPPYYGPLQEMDQNWLDYRSSVSPNFYAEGIRYDWYLGEYGELRSAELDAMKFEHYMTFTPHHYDMILLRSNNTEETAPRTDNLVSKYDLL